MGNSPDDVSEIAILRLTLDELFTDHRFFIRQSMTAGQVADYILSLVQKGERDLDRLKALAFEKFSCTSARLACLKRFRSCGELP
jgi:hypothetical protein